jgi:quinol monooxygenase YgiN
VLADYHLRVGQVTADTRIPDGCRLLEQWLDETQTGEGTTVTLIDAVRDEAAVRQANAEQVATELGLDPDAAGLVSWDVFHAVLAPGDVITLLAWHDQAAADAFQQSARLAEGARLRQVRIVRDYGMYDRRENPSIIRRFPG